MPEIRIAVSLASLRQPLKKGLHTAARMGAVGVEIDGRNGLRPQELTDTGLRQLRKMMDDLNLRIASVRFQTRRGYDTLADLDRRIDATKDAMRMAYRLGAPVVINSVGHVAEDPEHPGRSQLKSSLGDLARFGQHVGAMLACETGAEPVERLCGLLDSMEEQAIGINFNPGNLIANDFYDDNSIRHCASKVLSVTALDAVRDLARGRGVEVEVGRGCAEFPNILGVLEEQGYQGWFTVDQPSSTDPEYDLGNAIRFLRTL